MVLGFITLFCFIISSLKFITKRMKNKKLDHFFALIHKFSATGLIVCSVFHMIFSLRLFYQRPIVMTLIGFILELAVFALLLSHVFAKRLKKQWILIHRGATLVILICVCVHMYLGFSSFTSYKNQISGIKIYDVDASEIKDGDYTGYYDAGYIQAKVSVIVKSEKITSINLLDHKNEKGKRAEIITDRIVDAQSTNVDTVTGATNSSKVIIKAVENALEGAKKDE